MKKLKKTRIKRWVIIDRFANFEYEYFYGYFTEKSQAKRAFNIFHLGERLDEGWKILPITIEY